MSETTSNSSETEKELFPKEETNNFDFLNSVLDAQSPILPRSDWQNWRAFLKVLVKAKQSQRVAETTATFWD